MELKEYCLLECYDKDLNLSDLKFDIFDDDYKCNSKITF